MVIYVLAWLTDDGKLFDVETFKSGAEAIARACEAAGYDIEFDEVDGDLYSNEFIIFERPIMI